MVQSHGEPSSRDGGEFLGEDKTTVGKVGVSIILRTTARAGRQGGTGPRRSIDGTSLCKRNRHSFKLIAVALTLSSSTETRRIIDSPDERVGVDDRLLGSLGRHVGI